MFVPHYGIHWTPDGIAFLEQGGPKGGSNALGLPQKSPFRVRLERPRPCNHNIPLAAPALNPVHRDEFDKLDHDPLVRAMFPIPKREGTPGAWYVNDNGDTLSLYLALLSRMSSPIHSIIHPIWTLKLNAIIEELKQTNVQPLVLTDVAPRDTETLGKLAKLAPIHPRSLVLVGKPEVAVPQPIERIETMITKFNIRDLMPLPWEVLGATLVRKYMRNELNDENAEARSD